nr:MAG TPA: hypothetical protein [Caudoviricetes sp.]
MYEPRQSVRWENVKFYQKHYTRFKAFKIAVGLLLYLFTNKEGLKALL